MQRSKMATMVATVVAAWLLCGNVADLKAQAAGPAVGQPASAGQTGKDAQDQFVPANTLPQQEKLPAATFVMVAYGIVWAVLLVYLWTIWRRLMKVEREMQQLSSRVAESAARH
jgi:CcmD family protein